MSDILFIQPANIYERTQVHSNIDNKFIIPIIKVCQDMYILPLLGTALYNRLQTGISASTLTAGEITLLQSYVRDCLIYYVVSELPDTLSYQFWNKGVLRKTNEGSETATQSELIDLKNKYKNWAEFYGQRLAKYLVEQSNIGNFTLYLNPGNGSDVIHPKRNAYETGIYLGNDGDCRGCEDSPKRQYGKNLY